MTTKCPLCENDDYFIWAEGLLKAWGDLYTAYKCRNCLHIWREYKNELNIN